MAATLKVLRHITNPTPSMDVYLLEEQFCRLRTWPKTAQNCAFMSCIFLSVIFSAPAVFTQKSTAIWRVHTRRQPALFGDFSAWNTRRYADAKIHHKITHRTGYAYAIVLYNCECRKKGNTVKYEEGEF